MVLDRACKTALFSYAACGAKQMRYRHMQIKHDRFPAIAAPATVASPPQVSP